MSVAKELVFGPINFEEQKKNQPDARNYETYVREMKNGKSVDTHEETGFMLHQYSQLAPKEIKTVNKTITYKPAQRNYIKANIYPDQKSCLELEEQINAYDDALDENREVVFHTYNKLFTHVRSVKEPKEADDLDVSANPDKIAKPKYKSVKLRLEMGWNYYLDDIILDNKNSGIVRNAFFDAKKRKVDPKNISVKLHFTDEEGVENIREVKMGDIKQEKDKILTKVMFRRPQTIPDDAKKVEDCTEKELNNIYGKGEIVDVNTASDLDKYYQNGCYIRFVYEPLKVYAERNKGEDKKRKCSYIFQIKLIDIINIKKYNTSSRSNKQYEDYVFGQREQEQSDEQTTNHVTSKSSTTKSVKQVVVEKDDDEIDGEEQEEQEEQKEQEEQDEQEEQEEQEEEEEEEEPVVETKPKGRGKVVVEDTKTKPAPRKAK